MICEVCRKEGKTSKVFSGMGSVTLAYCPPFYDEKGKYHNHDSNITTTNCHCSNGHHWVEKNQNVCWCGWPNKE